MRKPNVKLELGSGKCSGFCKLYVSLLIAIAMILLNNWFPGVLVRVTGLKLVSYYIQVLTDPSGLKCKRGS